jgi:PIN domain nuclease of toxin-antitoxin system
VTVLLDAFALVAYFTDEPAAAQVQRLLWDGPAAISAVQVAEVVDRLARVVGVDPDEAEVACSALGLELLPVSPHIGIAAGLLRSRHYGPSGRSLSLADCVCAATALFHDIPLATADPVLLAVVQHEGGTVIELPGSS